MPSRLLVGRSTEMAAHIAAVNRPRWRDRGAPGEDGGAKGIIPVGTVTSPASSMTRRNFHELDPGTQLRSGRTSYQKSCPVVSISDCGRQGVVLWFVVGRALAGAQSRYRLLLQAGDCAAAVIFDHSRYGTEL